MTITEGVTLVRPGRPWLAIPWAAYYFSMEGIDRYDEVIASQRVLWDREDADRHWQMYKRARLELSE